MRHAIITFLSSLFLSILNSANAQFYNTGEPPTSIKWMQINTPELKIVFPEKVYYEANKFINLIEYYKTNTEYGLLHTPGKIPVIMHQAPVKSNGYVAWAPKRMELFINPPAENFAQDWLTQLAIHEYRHVIQVDMLRQGFTRVLSLFTGEIATGIASSMVPLWLYEGDAVLNETRLSETGRGRVASFDMPLRALISENVHHYSYDKMVFGSYKNYVPDHYQFGFHIVSYGITRFGDFFWGNALRFTGKNSYLVSPLAIFLKNNTGFDKENLYNKTMDTLKYLYNNNIDNGNYTDNLILTSYQVDLYTNYKGCTAKAVSGKFLSPS